MTTIFYLFAAQPVELERSLAAYGLELADLDREFHRLCFDHEDATPSDRSKAAREPDCNPWRFVDACGAQDESVPDGVGTAFVGEAEHVRAFLSGYCNDRGEPLLTAPFLGFETGLAPATGAGVRQWQHWCPGGTFATRAQGRRLIGADRLGDGGLDGTGVTVVIVDHGFSAAYVEDALGGQFGGGLTWSGGPTPGAPARRYTKAPRLHGDMIARNVLAIAPGATLYDFPLIPDRIERPYSFSLLAAFGYFALELRLVTEQAPWIVVSPWAIFDTLREPAPGNYTQRRNNPLNRVVARMARRHDMVFPAGNNGQFCPARRSGPYDRGPGRSILGANALEEVLTVGASRVDGLWIGASSQGPGPSSLTTSGNGLNEKPDVTAPSWFRDPLDAGLADTGTSAASAVAGGAVAALRTVGKGTTVSPTQLKSAMRDTARSFWHVGWNGRAGAGMLDVVAVAAFLGLSLPSPTTPAARAVADEQTPTRSSVPTASACGPAATTATSLGWLGRLLGFFGAGRA